MNIDFTWTRDDDTEVIIAIEFTCSEVIPATRWDPAEGGEVTIVRFTSDGPAEDLERFEDDYARGGELAAAVDEKCYDAAPSVASCWAEGLAEWLI